MALTIRNELNDILTDLVTKLYISDYTLVFEYERSKMAYVLEILGSHDLEDENINYLITTDSDRVFLTLSKNKDGGL